MKSLSMLALAAPIVMALTSAAVADAQTDAVHYLVRTEANGDKLAELAVTVTMPAHVGESLVLDLPRLLAADRIAARLTVDGAEVDPATANASVADKLQIRATATAVTLHYRLRSDGSDSPLADQDNP